MSPAIPKNNNFKKKKSKWGENNSKARLLLCLGSAKQIAEAACEKKPSKWQWWEVNEDQDTWQ